MEDMKSVRFLEKIFQSPERVSIEWEVKGVLVEEKNSMLVIESENINFLEKTWSLLLFPDGSPCADSSQYIGLFLKCYSRFTAFREFNVMFEITDHSGKRFASTKFTIKSKGAECWGCSKLINKDSFCIETAGVLPEKTINIKCDITAVGIFCTPYYGGDLDDTYDFSDFPPDNEMESKHQSSAVSEAISDFALSDGDGFWMEAFGALYDSKQFSDVTLRVGNEEIRAHKVILSSRSKVFHAMLSNDMKEKQEDVINLPEMNIIVAKELLRYMYTEKVGTLPFKSVLELYSVADRYDLLGLRNKCRVFLMKNLSADNVCDAIMVANLHSDNDLEEKAFDYFSSNMKNVLKSKTWESLEKEKPEFCFSLFKKATLAH